MIIILHDETRKLLIEAWNKTHNAKEIAECFSVNTSTVYRLEKQMRETGSVKTMTSQRGRKHALTPEDIQNIDRVVQQEPIWLVCLMLMLRTFLMIRSSEYVVNNGIRL